MILDPFAIILQHSCNLEVCQRWVLLTGVKGIKGGQQSSTSNICNVSRFNICSVIITFRLSSNIWINVNGIYVFPARYRRTMRVVILQYIHKAVVKSLPVRWRAAAMVTSYVSKDALKGRKNGHIKQSLPRGVQPSGELRTKDPSHHIQAPLEKRKRHMDAWQHLINNMILDIAQFTK